MASRFTLLTRVLASARGLSTSVSRRPNLLALGASASHSPPASYFYIPPALLCSAVALAAYNRSHAEASVAAPQKNAVPTLPEPDSQDVLNWSGTHAVSTKAYYQPENLEELKAIVAHAHASQQKIRPVGSALSPNGLPLCAGGMVNMSNMDNIVSIDRTTNRVTIEAGARIAQVVDALRPHGLTLQNFASITEQQVAGFVQVGAHGTGATIPPVDEQVVAVKLITPAAGELTLSIDDDDPSLFRLARTSLGLLGVVAEVTLQCVPAHKLVEHTTIMTRAEVSAKHEDMLKKNRHLRYMWIPYTDCVVVVTCNPAGSGDKLQSSSYSNDEKLSAARELLLSHPRNKLNKASVHELHFTALRDELLALDPLDVGWVKRVNQAEAEFWKRCEGTRVDWSDRILQFDCGGQQWVSEVSFPVHKKKSRDDESTDLQFMNNLLKLIESEKIAAPAPLEQRWTAPSSSPMSPAAERPEVEQADLYSWVGIIMYLPDEEVDKEARAKITEAFKRYKKACEYNLWPDVGAVEHWAKIEMPEGMADKMLLQVRMRRKYPVDAFNAICDIFDPHGILRNELTNVIFGKS